MLRMLAEPPKIGTPSQESKTYSFSQQIAAKNKAIQKEHLELSKKVQASKAIPKQSDNIKSDLHSVDK